MAEKNFKGAPFGTQTARFDVAGIHPQSKTPGTYTQVPYQKHKQQNKYLKWTGLAPGCYNIDVRDSFNKKVVKMKADGPGWERQYKVAQLARMPHLLHRLEAKRAEERVRRLGPGTYNHTDFVQKNNEQIPYIPMNSCFWPYKGGNSFVRLPHSCLEAESFEQMRT